MVEEVAERLNLGKNRVPTTTAGGEKLDIDLKGDAHCLEARSEYIEAPYVHEGDPNSGPGGKVNGSNKRACPRAREDVRLARCVLEHRSRR